MTKKQTSLLIDILILIFLIIAGLKFSSNLKNNLDIVLFDESGYLYRGVNLFTHGFPEPKNGPLYSVWYFFLSLFEPDKVNLYYLNYKLSIIIPPLLLYLLLRKHFINLYVSFAISWFFLISQLNAKTWPRVSHFALILILLTLIFLTKRSPRSSLFQASFGALLMSYVRPEFMLTFIILVALSGIMYLLGKEKKVHWIKLGTFVLLSTIFLVGIGNPISGGRSFVAFGQHFALNWVKWTGDARNSWTSWRDIIYDNYGQINNTWEALISNPSIFLKHVMQNIKNLIVSSSYLPFPSDFTTDLFSKSVLILMIIGLCIKNFSHLQNNYHRKKIVLLILGLFSLPSLISTLIIYPRHHYILFLIILLVISVNLLLKRNHQREAQKNPSNILLAGLFIIGITPYMFTPGVESARQPEMKTIRYIQSLDITDPVNLLDAQGGIHYYLGPNYDRVHESHKRETFSTFLEKQNINMILITPALLEDARYIDDKEWSAFLMNYQEKGFVEMDVPVSNRTMLVDSRLLP